MYELMIYDGSYLCRGMDTPGKFDVDFGMDHASWNVLSSATCSFSFSSCSHELATSSLAQA
jgi:hypothetical protein